MSNAVAVRENGKTRSVGAVTVVHFDRPLRELDPEDAEAWRAWLVQHQLDALTLACPSVLVYQEPTAKKLASVTVDLLVRDPRGVLRSKKTITFSGLLLPFPGGYRVTRQERAPRGTRARTDPARVA